MIDIRQPITVGKTAAFDDPRSLIDILHEATFTSPVGMQWVQDKYALRMALRKAHCFTVDAETSAMVADFSIAVAKDLDSARQLAVPPFPITWFEIDNIARLRAIKKHGVRLTLQAASEDVCKRVGWMITTHGNDYVASYMVVTGQGPVFAPLSYRWTAERPCFDQVHTKSEIEISDKLVFGCKDSGVNPMDASLCGMWPQRYVKKISGQEYELMNELSGELRHIFGLLIALGASHGTKSATGPGVTFQGEPVVAKGKTLLPLEHKVLTIKLGRKATADTVVARAVTGIKHRWHEVRGHIRTLRNSDGTVRKLVKVKDHHRGDERLGKITKTYHIEK